MRTILRRTISTKNHADSETQTEREYNSNAGVGDKGHFPEPDKYRVEQKTMLSSVTHVPSGLIGCASAALGWWVGRRRKVQT